MNTLQIGNLEPMEVKDLSISMTPRPPSFIFDTSFNKEVIKPASISFTGTFTTGDAFSLSRELCVAPISFDGEFHHDGHVEPVTLTLEDGNVITLETRKPDAE